MDRPNPHTTRRQILALGGGAALALGLGVAPQQAAAARRPGAPSLTAANPTTPQALSPTGLTTPLSATTSWTGNTFSGASQWVQDFVFNIAVSPDGSVYTVSFWDEAHQYAGIYKDAKVIGNCSGANGDAVAYGGQYAYLTVGNGLTRFTAAGAATSLVFNVGSPPAAAAASATQVVATDRVNNQVKVFDAATGTLQHSWAVNQPGAVALAANGDIWVVSNITRDPGDAHFWQVDTTKPARVLRFSNTGSALPGTITGPSSAWIPTSLAIDHNDNLLVGDNGPLRQVHRYGTLTTGSPRLVSSFGKAGGIGAGTPGDATDPQKLFGIVGVGSDAQGNLYVALNEFGVWLRKFDPTGKLVWQLEGAGFVVTADTDPASDGLDVYTTQNHYRIDPAKPPGQDATWVGHTLDSVKYPQDCRLFLTDHHHNSTSPYLRRMNNQLYMYITGMYSGHLLIYRFDGEIAKPSGAIFKKPWTDAPGWPPNQPAQGEWIWRDTSGNGAFEAGEFTTPGTGKNAPSNCWVWFVDDKLNLWEGGDRNLRYFPIQGFDSQANPIYTYASMKTVPLPAPFTVVRRLHYDVASDVMYMSGYTADDVFDNAHWKEAGKVLTRYDKWSAGNPTPTWSIKLPWDTTVDPVLTPGSLAWAGDYIFMSGIATRGQVWVFKAKDGSAVGTWQPGSNVGGVNQTGWVDIPYGMNATKRSNGEYIINLEDDQWNKVLLYRWKP
ncbi:hypothetical protein ACWCXX_21885 [Streptomyces sp. NPDC001732]